MRRLIIYCIALWSMAVSCVSDTSDSVDVGENPIPTAYEVNIRYMESGDTPVIIFSSDLWDFNVAYDPRLDGEVLDFSSTTEPFPLVGVDQYGNRWDVFGQCTSGIYAGRRLKSIKQMELYWMTCSATFPNIRLNDESAMRKTIIPSSIDPEWSIPYQHTYRGAARNVIKALSYPEFITYHRRRDLDDPIYLDPEDIVIAISSGDHVKVYPLEVMQYHEIVHDRVGGEEVVVIHSPYSGSSSVWSAGDMMTTYEVSGLVYNGNILLQSVETDDYWSQVLYQQVSGGSEIQPKAIPFPYIQTKWSTISQSWMEVDVLDVPSYTAYDYDTPVLPGYDTSQIDIPFHIWHQDDRLLPKDKVWLISPAQGEIAYTKEYIR